MAWEMWTELLLHGTFATRPAEVFHMAAEKLKCKECGTEYPLEARYVCERCFGPLEVGLRGA